jgi:hypothetical protein
MLKTCRSLIRTSSAPDSVPADGFFKSSYSNSGLLIELTDPVWIEKLLNSKPQSILFEILLATKIMPSKTPPSSTGSYAVILPDKAEFWFKLPNKTEWLSNRPLANVRINNTVSSEYGWSVAFGGTYIASTFCLPERNKPPQTNSFEELLKTCQSMLEKDVFGNWKAPTFSYSNGGLLMQLTDPETLEFLNNNLSQPIFFRTSEPFDVTPTYE